MIALNLLSKRDYKSETEFFTHVKKCRFDEHRLSSSVFIDHRSEKITIILIHDDIEEAGELILELPFEQSLLTRKPVECSNDFQTTIDLMEEKLWEKMTKSDKYKNKITPFFMSTKYGNLGISPKDGYFICREFDFGKAVYEVKPP